ncbi:MAG TPA: M24 family metallopeptidase [Longimicrobiales bacterium]|nr:M24 family metallopeptidase [Longimicrobiales bacterium]
MKGAFASDFRTLRDSIDEIREALLAENLDGWLLYDLHARNPVAVRMLGLGDLTRRFFVLIPREGEPHALIHGIERTPWQQWPWSTTAYVGWAPLRDELQRLVTGKRLAMEYSASDAVPAMDLVPAGVVEMVRQAGAADVQSSGNLVSRFYSRWSPEGLASHRRAARVLADTARDAFTHLADATRDGGTLTEGALKAWVLAELERRGASVGADAIVANTVNAADPHYEPGERGAELRSGDLVLLDLWSKETEEGIYADQTWMGFLGERVPDRIQDLFAVIRDGRDAGVQLLRERWTAGTPIRGYEVDDATRGVVSARGYGDAFIHRTGHSIDQATHGMGPNIDNLETRETRTLIEGVGFSIEPGVYLAGDIGLRTEIDVFMGADGPEVTTPEPQDSVWALYGGRA